MQNLQLELSDIKTRLFDTDVKMKASESKNGELAAKDADNQRKVKELSTSVKKYQGQLNDLEKKNVYLEGKVSGLEVKLESELRIKSDLSAMQADCEDRLREARDTNNRLDHTLNSFKEDAQKMQTGYQVLETQVTDLTDTNKKLIDVVKDVQGKEESLRADKTKLEGRVKRLSATVKEKDAAITKLVQEKARVQQEDQAKGDKIAALTKAHLEDIARLDAELGRARAGAAEQAEQLTALSAQLESRASELGLARGVAADRGEQLTALSAQLDTRAAELGAAETQLVDLRAQLRESERHHAAADAEVEQLKTEVK